jgi:hydroxymethylpyrimidine/phosphomethylpyrimidine kinase
MKQASDREAKRTSPAVCLTIAGFDPSSGAGITADLKTFGACGAYGVAAITALTVQSSLGVQAVEPVAPSLLRQTLECLAADLTLNAVKIGMLGTAGAVLEAERFLRSHPELRECTVLDPVCRSSSGAALLDREGMALLVERLLGLVRWVTPNLDELAALTGSPVVDRHVGRDEVPRLAERLASLAAVSGNPALCIVVTGGHLDRPDDYVIVDGRGSWISGDRVETTSTHGTGCAFSSALAAGLANGLAGIEAVRAAKEYVTEALRAATPIGRGHGPIHHLFALDAVRR